MSTTVATNGSGTALADRAARRRRERAGHVQHLTKAERAAVGKAARARVPRSAHAAWAPAPDRADPVAELEEQARTRVPELVPIRYGRMLVSPFTFYRGAARIMAADLAPGPRTGLIVQLCGDAHLSNFGVFAAPDRRLVFSTNDFDETLPGPFEWDVKRLVASFAVAGRDRAFDSAQRERVNLAVVRAYREAMHEFASMRMLDVWYARLNVDDAQQWLGALTPKQRRRFERNVEKARAKDSVRAYSRLTEVVDGRRRIVSDPPLIVPIDDLVDPAEREPLHTAIRDLLRAYRRTLQHDRTHLLEQFRYADTARKVVGVGSVGMRAWVVLLLGTDESDPLFLQVKEAQASVLESFLPRSRFNNHGQRVVEGQRLTQAASDVLLGWIRSPGLDGVTRDFYVRQLWDGKGSAAIETMQPNVMETYARACGWTLARGHARAGDAVAIAAYLGSSDTFDKAMAAFAEVYADQNERDYAALREAVDAGAVAATSGL